MRTISMIYEDVADTVIEKHKNKSSIVHREICSETMELLRMQTAAENAILPKSQQLKCPNDIPPQIIIQYLKELEEFKIICRTPRLRSRQECQVGFYVESGENEGLYVTDTSLIYSRMTRYNGSLKHTQLVEIYQGLQRECEVIYVNTDEDLIPLKNGVFHYKRKVLLPFSKNMVFIKKCPINFNPQRTKPPVYINADGSTWNIEDWMLSLSNDAETANLLFQVCGAVLRPLVAWEQMLLLYSNVGRNGKGSVCVLLRELAGEGNYASITLKQMTSRFGISQLMDVSAIITDENTVSPDEVLGNLEAIKAIITADHLSVERKFENPVDYKCHSVIVNCINAIPRFSDTTQSMARRMLFVDFPNTFTGCDNKAIKADYLHRVETLEYVVYKVLVQMPDYYEFDVPEASKRLLNMYEINNDSVRDFWNQFRDEVVWDICPGAFLYALYRAYYEKNVSKRCDVMGRNAFYEKLTQIVSQDDEWYTQRTSLPVTSTMRFHPEPLILAYNLTDWMNKDYSGSDPDRLTTPDMKASISRPFIRKSRIKNVSDKSLELYDVNPFYSQQQFSPIDKSDDMKDDE